VGRHFKPRKSASSRYLTANLAGGGEKKRKKKTESKSRQQGAVSISTSVAKKKKGGKEGKIPTPEHLHGADYGLLVFCVVGGRGHPERRKGKGKRGKETAVRSRWKRRMCQPPIFCSLHHL